MSAEIELKEIPNYPGYYATSDGRILGKRKKGFLNQSIVSGYNRVSLCRNGKIDNVLVHSIVDMTFIPNPHNKPDVNHLDENKQNNCVDNLEWATPAENNNYGTRRCRMIATQTNRKDCSKPVAQIDKNGTVIAVYPSSKEAWRKTGISHSHIRDVCKLQKYKTAGGFRWMWANLDDYTRGGVSCL